MVILEFSKLELLELVFYAYCGKEWYPNVMRFNKLSLLLNESGILKHWKAINENFPTL